ncbi:Hypothetical predicted protein, partial [Olea europaea subsp. europaea]
MVGILAILGETVKTVECFSNAKCNGSAIGDCVLINEEFMMESEISRRILGQQPQSNVYNSLKLMKTFCKRDVYGNCIGDPNAQFKKRPCDYNNLC